MRNTDIILIVPLIWGIYRGFFKGLLAGVTSLVTIIVAFYVSLAYSSVFESFINYHIHTKLSSVYITIAAFTILFILVFVIMYAISIKIERLAHTWNLSSFNHIGGAIFGLIKWAFLISLVMALITTLGHKGGFTLMHFNNTWLYDHIQVIAPDILPDLLDKIRKFK